MNNFEVEGNKVFIGWFPIGVKLFEIDEWVEKVRATLDPEEDIMIDVSMCGPNTSGDMIDMSSTVDELKKIKLPDPNKPYRIRLANHLNFITEIYNTLRKLNFAINQSLKDDVISETIIYFMNRWEKYEYHPRTIPIAVQKYKSLNIDIYRKEKRNIPIDDENNKYLPKSLESIEGLPYKEIEQKQNFKIVAEAISKQLERRVAFRRVLKKAIQATMDGGAAGIKVQISGRVGGAEIARTEWYKEGRIPLHTLRVDINYAIARAETTYGSIGVKVWINKGE